MKVKSVIRIYLNVQQLQLMNLNPKKFNLEYHLKSLTFGSHLNQTMTMLNLSKFESDIALSIDPLSTEKPNRDWNASYSAKHNIKVFPVKFKSDLEPSKNTGSYEYSFIKKLKPLNDSPLQQGSLDFQFEFLPIVSVYHIKKTSKIKLIIGVFAISGGVFVIFEVINNFLASLFKKLI